MRQLGFSYLFPTVYYGQLLKVPEVEYFRGRQASAGDRAPVEVYADREYGCQTPIERAVEPAALDMITIRA
jgi:diacylglycerol kinase family enzyme